MREKWKFINVVLAAIIFISLILVNQVNSQEFLVECNPTTHYSCSDGSGCIDRDYICNGHKDCLNNDDEENCGKFLFFKTIFFSL
jgi:Low-density lipoprotein receptor domain class A